MKSDTDALIHVYNILVSNLEKSDAGFRVKVKNIEATYNQSTSPFTQSLKNISEHTPRLETKSISTTWRTKFFTRRYDISQVFESIHIYYLLL